MGQTQAAWTSFLAAFLAFLAFFAFTVGVAPAAGCETAFVPAAGDDPSAQTAALVKTSDAANIPNPKIFFISNSFF